MTYITVTHEDHRIEEFAFAPSKKIISLGRRSNNDVCIPDLSVSGNHAIITVNGDELVLEDLKSTNGSYINGEFIQRANISSNAEIILGKILINVRSAAAPRTTETARPVPLASENSAAYAEQPPASRDSFESDRSSPENDYTRADVSAPAYREPSLDGAPTNNNIPKPAQAPADEHPLNGVEHLVVPETGFGAEPINDNGTALAAKLPVAAIEIKNGVKSGQRLPIDKPVTTLGRPGIQIAAIMRKPDGYFLMHIESDKGVNRPVLNDDVIGDEPVSLRNGDAFTIAGIDVQFMLS